MESWADEFTSPTTAGSWADEFTESESPVETVNGVTEEPSESTLLGGDIGIVESIKEGAKDLYGNIAALPEVAAQMGSALVAKPVSEIAGMTGVATDIITGEEGDPSGFQESVREGLTIDPQTEQGKAISESALNPINIIGKAVHSVANFTSSFGEDEPSDEPLGMLANLVREATIQAPALAGAKAGSKAALAKKQAALDIQKGAESLQTAAREQAHAANLITPAEKGVKAQVSGVAKTDQFISSKNQVTATEIIKKELGIPSGEAISESHIASLRQTNYKAYEAVTKEASRVVEGISMKIKPTAPFKEVITKHLAEAQDMIKAYPVANKAYRQAEKLFKEQLKVKSHDPALMMQNVKQMRAEANTLYSKSNKKPSDLATASAKLSIANALEGLMENHLVSLGKGDLMVKFREARTNLAQIHAVETAVNRKTGMIDIKTMTKLAEKTKFTGGLRTVADFGLAFKNGALSVSGAPKMIGLFDTVVAGASLVAKHPGFSVMEMGGRIGIPVAAGMKLLQTKTPTYQAGSKLRSSAPGVGAAIPSQTEKWWLK